MQIYRLFKGWLRWKEAKKKVLKKHREPAQETNKQNEHEFAFCFV